tara:strand:+ start:222 stop:440 length:219 start_codon:yes stop_codon:yes gene_type:complete
MEIITLTILLIGIVFILMGYMELVSNEKKCKKKVEYRAVPMDVYNQIQSTDLDDQFEFMFYANDVRQNTNLV